MRTITEFAERPNETDLIASGDNKITVFVREDITEVEREEGTAYTAVEYSTTVNANGFELTDAFIEKLKEDEANKAAAAVRAKRNRLLTSSDCEVLPDRVTKSSDTFKAWAAYRQELRDITDQEGFPFEVVFPERP